MDRFDATVADWEGPGSRERRVITGWRNALRRVCVHGVKAQKTEVGAFRTLEGAEDERCQWTGVAFRVESNISWLVCVVEHRQPGGTPPCDLLRPSPLSAPESEASRVQTIDPKSNDRIRSQRNTARGTGTHRRQGEQAHAGERAEQRG